MTKLLGVIGDPIKHSLSPQIHNAWLEAAGIDANYEAIHVKDGGLKEALKDLSDRAVVGLNITLPHKHSALELAVSASDAATKIGAANTLTRKPEGGWVADNTDAPGFLRALSMAGIEDLSKERVLVFGAGGSARAIVYALFGVGVIPVILNRTIERAASLSKQITAAKALYGSLDQSTEYLEKCSLVINTSSGGHSGDIHHLPAGEDRLFFDISYGVGAGQQLLHAVDKGWRTQDGLGMLVAQAAESFNIWFGQMPDTEAALKTCRKTVEAAQ